MYKMTDREIEENIHSGKLAHLYSMLENEIEEEQGKEVEEAKEEGEKDQIAPKKSDALGILLLILFVAIAFWLHSLFDEQNPPPLANEWIVNTDCNIRSGPSTGYSVIDQAGKGERVAVEGEEGDWDKVTYKNETGYIHKKLLDRKE